MKARLIKVGLRYWSTIKEINSADELIAHNTQLEKAYRLRHGREPKRAYKTLMLSMDDFNCDQYPDAVKHRISRMQKEIAF